MSDTFPRLRSFIQRIERVQEEIDGLNADKKEVYAEARGTGFDVRIMKMLIAERRKEPHVLAETNELLDLYRAAMIGTEVATRAPARKSPPSAVANSAHDPNTGEITEQHPKPGAGVEGMGNGDREMPAETMLEPNLGYATGRTVEDGLVPAERGSRSQDHQLSETTSVADLLGQEADRQSAIESGPQETLAKTSKAARPAPIAPAPTAVAVASVNLGKPWRPPEDHLSASRYVDTVAEASVEMPAFLRRPITSAETASA